MYESALAEVRRRIQALLAEYEAGHVRALLFVAYDREIAPGERWEAGEAIITVDPYTQTDQEVLELWKAKGDEVSGLIYETGDYLKGEDYEAIDSIEGASGALGRALQILDEVEAGD